MHPAWLVIVAGLFACKSPHPEASTTPVAPKPVGPSCAQVSDHLMLMLDQPARSASQDLIDQMRIQVQKACEDTAWSVEARQCVLDAKVPADTQRCEAAFTQAQRDAFGGSPPKGQGAKSEKVPIEQAPTDHKRADPCDGGE